MRGKLKQPPMPAGSGGVRMRAHLGSLRARLVLYVFCIMTMASLFTSAAYVVMLSAGWLRPLFITQMMSPIWMVCVSSIIGTVITAWIGKYYLSPVTQVIAATKRVAKGDFSVQLPMEDGRGEMGDLVRSFNRMNEWTDPVRTHGTARFEGLDIHGSGIDLRPRLASPSQV